MSSEARGARRADVAELAVELRDVTKRYGEVTACRAVSLQVRRGEIHGLLGENGAGKTTLMKVLIGLVRPDGGEILLGGEPVVVGDPVHAGTLGLAMAQQHFSLVERLKVWENVALAHRGRVKRGDAARLVVETGEHYGIVVDPDARVEDLTVGQRQRVELVKCLSLRPEVLVLDEPTSVLSGAESRELFSVLRQVVRRDQMAVILISHKLDEILHATDRVTVMRDGSVVASMPTVDADARQLARSMVGRDVVLLAEMAAVGLLEEEGFRAAGESTPVPDRAAVGVSERAPSAPHEVAAPVARPAVLRFDDVTVRGPDGRLALDGLTITVGAGEIVGVAGVEGNGQGAIGDLMSGLLLVERGSVEVRGQRVGTGPAELLGAGVGVVPEDRHASGCVLSMSVEENLVATDLDRYRGRGALLDRRAMRRRAEQLIRDYAIAAPSPRAPLSALSGGHQQRVVLARELSRDPAVLIAVGPTRGLDVGAVEYIVEQLRAAAGRGVGILLVSTEIDELLAVADRIVVLHGGRAVGEMPRDAIDVDRLGRWMGGLAS